MKTSKALTFPTVLSMIVVITKPWKYDNITYVLNYFRCLVFIRPQPKICLLSSSSTSAGPGL